MLDRAAHRKWGMPKTLHGDFVRSEPVGRECRLENQHCRAQKCPRLGNECPQEQRDLDAEAQPHVAKGATDESGVALILSRRSTVHPVGQLPGGGLETVNSLARNASPAALRACTSKWYVPGSIPVKLRLTLIDSCAAGSWPVADA